MITKLPKVKREKFNSVICECPACDRFYHFACPEIEIKPRERDGVKWLEGVCDSGHVYRNFDVDFIQPKNPFYHLLYKNFDDEYNRKKRVAKLEEEQRKADLDRKYYEKYRGVQKSTMTLLEKSIRKEVLSGD